MDNFYETPTLSAARSGKIETSLCLLDNPDDVINHPRLSRGEKRALLSSWASDACAVENQPALRRLDNGTVIPVDQILRALKALDEKPTLGKETSGRCCLGDPPRAAAVSKLGGVVAVLSAPTMTTTRPRARQRSRRAHAHHAEWAQWPGSNSPVPN
ncbi:hypothetical protein ACYG9R_24930 [Mesorhizobium sp. RSR565B]|uniref:hypothetical protein n=1 Tax=Mesorhizobium sp. L103C565B0 TaxID=1287094 RepID=UPI000423D395|nr:hypothetical protein [Mesorhizobium sp. L103C565B0]